MRILGFEIARTRAPQSLQSVDNSAGWWSAVREPYAGAWQRDWSDHRTRGSRETVLAFPAVYACVSHIAGDIAKMSLQLTQEQPDGSWTEADSPAFSPILRKPNSWQARISFYQQWMFSKLFHGNTYVLKEYDNRQVLSAMYVLDPTRCTPLVSPETGDIYYSLRKDPLSGLDAESIEVPASQIIHDINDPIFHPLVGVSPLVAAGLPALQGLSIQQHSSKLFRNAATPSGILTAPGVINEDTAKRLKARWEENYTGANYGRVAILGNGLKFETTSTNAVDAQLIEQLNWDQRAVCNAFKVPPEIVGIDIVAPRANTIEQVFVAYYSRCLQIHIESIEALLDDALGLPDVPGKNYKVRFNIDQLLRMDSLTLYQTLGEGVQRGFLAPDEARGRIGLGPVAGGSIPYLQQQNFSLEALAKRDATANPFSPTGGTAPPSAGEGQATPQPEPAASRSITDLAEIAEVKRIARQALFVQPKPTIRDLGAGDPD